MKNVLLLLLTITSLIVLMSCEALMGAAAQQIDPAALATAVVNALVPEIAKIEGMTPEALAAIAAGLKDAITNSIPAPDPNATGDGLGMWGQILGFGLTAVGTYFGVNIKRDAKYVHKGRP